MAVDTLQFGRELGFGLMPCPSVSRIDCRTSSTISLTTVGSRFWSTPGTRRDSIEDLADVMAVIHHLIQNFPHPPEVEWHPLQKLQRGAAVRAMAPAVANFMSNRSRNHLDVHKLVISFTLQRDNSSRRAIRSVEGR